MHFWLLLKSKLFGCNRSQGVTCIHVKGDRSSSKKKECLPVQQSDYDVESNNNTGGSSNCLLASGWPDTQIDIAINRYESRAGQDMIRKLLLFKSLVLACTIFLRCLDGEIKMIHSEVQACMTNKDHQVGWLTIKSVSGTHGYVKLTGANEKWRRKKREIICVSNTNRRLHRRTSAQPRNWK